MASLQASGKAKMSRTTKLSNRSTKEIKIINLSKNRSLKNVQLLFTHVTSPEVEQKLKVTDKLLPKKSAKITPVSTEGGVKVLTYRFMWETSGMQLGSIRHYAKDGYYYDTVSLSTDHMGVVEVDSSIQLSLKP